MTLNHLCAGCRKARGRCVAKYVWNKQTKQHEQVCAGYKPSLRHLVSTAIVSIIGAVADLCDRIRQGATR